MRYISFDLKWGLRELPISGFYLSNPGAHSPSKYRTPPCLILVLWKCQVFLKVQSSVTSHGVIGVHEYFKFINEKSVFIYLFIYFIYHKFVHRVHRFK